MASTDAVPIKTNMIANTETAHRSKRFDKRPHGYANRMYTSTISPDPAITWPIATSQGTVERIAIIGRVARNPMAMICRPVGFPGLLRHAMSPVVRKTTADMLKTTTRGDDSPVRNIRGPATSVVSAPRIQTKSAVLGLDHQGIASFRMTAAPALPDGPRGENAFM